MEGGGSKEVREEGESACGEIGGCGVSLFGRHLCIPVLQGGLPL